MLYHFLKTIWTGEAQSLVDIARRLDISPAMALQIAKDLTTKGYLLEGSSDCNTAQGGCPDCPISGSCHALARSWLLTEKGQRAVSGTGTSPDAPAN